MEIIKRFGGINYVFYSYKDIETAKKIWSDCNGNVKLFETFLEEKNIDFCYDIYS